MFITEEDYRVVIGESALRIVTQSSEEVRSNAEQVAMEEVAGYLRPKYDTQAIFAARGDARNRQVVQITADIALYHMVSALPQKMGSEVRRERYQQALRWLEGVAAGRIIPDLPQQGDAEGNPVSITFKAQSEQPLRHNW